MIILTSTNERQNMIICKDKCYAYCGATAAEAYNKYVEAVASFKKLKMVLEPKPEKVKK